MRTFFTYIRLYFVGLPCYSIQSGLLVYKFDLAMHDWTRRLDENQSLSMYVLSATSQRAWYQFGVFLSTHNTVP